MNAIHNKSIAVIITASIFFQHCKSKVEENKHVFTDSTNFKTEFTYQELELANVNADSIFFFNENKKSFHPVVFDDFGIPLRPFNDRPIYHPSTLCDVILHSLYLYNKNGNGEHLEYALKIADKLDDIAFYKDSGMYFTYNFDYKLHGLEGELMTSPWISALSQGKLLTAYIRLYKVTNNETYLNSAKLIFNTFLHHQHMQTTYWTSFIDYNGYLWLEEFPMDRQCNTLNGMMAAIFGIYNYYQISHDERALKIIWASIHTIRENIEKFRKDGDLSYYCQKHKVQNTFYHSVHIRQLLLMHKITLDSFYIKKAYQFESDSVLTGKYRLHEF